MSLSHLVSTATDTYQFNAPLLSIWKSLEGTNSSHTFLRTRMRETIRQRLDTATKEQVLRQLLKGAVGHHPGVANELLKVLRTQLSLSGSLFCPSSLAETSNFGSNARVFAEAIANRTNIARYLPYDEDELRDFMEENNYIPVDGEFLHVSDTSCCDHCGYCVRNTNLGEVVEANESESWCDDCRDNDSFYCELTDNTYSSASYSKRTLRDGTSFCLERCTHDELVEYDDYEDEWYRMGDAPSHDAPDSLLPDYHGADRPWAASRYKIPFGAIGVELELGFADGDEGRESFLEDYLNTATNGRLSDLPFCVERDGSLEDRVPGGMELISDPLPYQSGYRALTSPWRSLLTTLLNHGARGWKYREYAGLHVNLDARGMSDADIFKYATFINNATALSQFVAGRTSIYHGSYQKKTSKWLRSNGLNWAKEDLLAEGKYAPVYMHESGSTRRLETRIFGSNLKYEGFMACVEYCTSVLEYVRGVDPVDVFSPTLGAEYRHWLAEHTKQFPYIAQRLGVVAAGVVVQKIQPLRAVA